MHDPILTRKTDLVTGGIDSETRLLAAIAYGEGSTGDVENELAGMAHAVANRAKAWNGRKVSEVIRDDPHYTYAVKYPNERYKLMQAASLDVINQSVGMRIAINAAREALSGTGDDPSNDAYWWDGIDLKDRRPTNLRIVYGFRYGEPSHNIFGMEPILKPTILYWQVRNKRTGEITNSKERGRFDCAYISRAAHGKTIFWRYHPDYVKASGAKEYK